MASVDYKGNIILVLWVSYKRLQFVNKVEYNKEDNHISGYSHHGDPIEFQSGKERRSSPRVVAGAGKKGRKELSADPPFWQPL